MGKLLFGAAVFLVAMTPHYSSADTRKVTFCTGESGLPYAQVGKAIRAMNARSRVMSIDLIENTGGSKSNLDRMLNKDMSARSGNCDMAIIQPSVLSEATKLDMSLRTTVQQVGTAHTEYVHLLCARASGVTTIKQLVNNPKKYSIALGSDASGAWSVWQSLKEAAPSLSDVTVTPEEASLALVAVSNNNTSCTLFPEGLRGKWMNTANAGFSSSVLLALADLGSFGNVKDFRGNRMFEYKTIPSKFYDKIQTGFFGSSVGTVVWKAGIFINTDKINDPTIVSALVTLIAKASPSIVNSLDNVK